MKKSNFNIIAIFIAIAFVATILLNILFNFLATTLEGIEERIPPEVLVLDKVFTFTNALFLGIGISLIVVMFICRMLKPLLVLLLYFVVQVFCSMLLPLFVDLSAGTSSPGFAAAMSWTLIVSSVLTVIVLHAVKLIDVTRPLGMGLKMRGTVLSVIAVIFLMFASNLLTEWMQLENLMAEEFIAMATTIPGALAIGIIGPITEEYVFREGIQGSMLRQGVTPWLACVFSAMVFGLVHGNPAQIPFAFLVGLVFAVVYMRTRSIIPVSICHIINNSHAVILMNIYSDRPDIGFKDIIGSETIMYVSFALALVVGLLMLVVSGRDNKTVEE
ncbi:MAG: CPBP family intramembrane metalloprotease [Bacteroidaceae bacterium]|nr:CPBP family intramembrane metalloprotease [Bacteroidaceae bacterium]